MEELLKKLLHVSVQEKTFDQSEKLPLLFTGLYDIRFFVIGEKTVYIVQPKEHVSLPKLKKHFSKLTTLLGEDCILYGDSYTRYGIAKLTEMGIPFVFGDNNIYLPNLGIQIHEKTKVKLPEVEKFSPFTQKLILTAMYQGWKYISGKDVAEKLNVSRMTVNRALIELEALKLPLITMEGKAKYLKIDFGREKLFEMCEDFFINPVKKSVRMSSIPESVCIKSGVTALAAYTMLGDDPYPTFAVNQEQYRNLQVGNENIAAKDDVPACIVQIHRYLIDENGVIDPISAVLSIDGEELEDARIEQAIEEIKEGVVNGRWTK